MRSFARALLNPPARLRPLADGPAKWFRLLWFICFGLASLTVVVSTIYVFNASYSIQPVVREHGLDFDVLPDGSLLVRSLPDPQGRSAVSEGSTVVAVSGSPVGPGFVIADLAKELQNASGKPLNVTLQKPSGQTVTVPLERKPVNSSAADERNRDMRIWARLATALLACSALLVCSLLLALRRPNDPVAMLLALGFTILVGTIDPPMQYWLWTDQDVVIDVVGGIAMYLLLVGLAAFPDGVFVPRFLRWLIPFGIPLAVFSSLPDIDEDVQGIVGISALLAVLAASREAWSASSSNGPHSASVRGSC